MIRLISFRMLKKHCNEVFDAGTSPRDYECLLTDSEESMGYFKCCGKNCPIWKKLKIPMLFT